MKRQISIILYGAICVFGLLLSCVRDDSTEFGSLATSDVSIEYPYEEISVYLHEETDIAPVVKQEMSDYDLSYEWSIYDADKKYPKVEVISTDAVLRYTFKNIGNYILKFRVSNSTNSTYKDFRMKAQTRFQEGVCVFGVNQDTGKADISMLETLSQEDIEQGVEPGIIQDCFEKVNPGIDLKDPLQIREGGRFIIVPTDEGKVYKFDRYTFELYSVSEPGIKMLGFYPDDYSQYYPEQNHTLCADGRMYFYNPVLDNFNIHTYYWDDYDNEGFDAVYCSDDEDYGRLFAIDYETSRVSYFWGWGVDDMFFEGQDYLNMFSPFGEKYGDHIVFTTDQEDPTLVNIYILDWSFTENLSDIHYNTSSLKLTKESDIVDTGYGRVYFNNGNGIYVWSKDYEDQLPETPVITVDGEVTCMNISNDGEELYVGVYKASASGRKGSVYVYNTADGSLLKKYEEVCDKPKFIFHKN